MSTIVSVTSLAPRGVRYRGGVQIRRQPRGPRQRLPVANDLKEPAQNVVLQKSCTSS
jgi:hypothetical protein